MISIDRGHAARQAFSLIELIVVLSTLMMAMGIVAACFAVTNASHSSVASDARVGRTIHDLSSRLRRDGHLASSRPDFSKTDPRTISWATSTGNVTYQTNGNRLLRRYEHAGETFHEAWRLDEDASINWLINKNGRLLRLQIKSENKATELLASFPLVGGKQ